MPRDFKIYRPRLRSPFISRLRNKSQVSINDEMPTSDCSGLLLIAGQTGQQRGNLPRFQKIHQAHEHGFGFQRAADFGESGHRIDHHHRGIEIADLLEHQRQVRLQALNLRPRRMETQQAALDPAAEIDADGAHIAHDLLLRFFKGKIHAALAARARGIDESAPRANSCPSRACRKSAHCRRGSSPCPSSMASSRAIPEEMRSVGASWFKPSDVTGNTEIPPSSIRNGYSLVP